MPIKDSPTDTDLVLPWMGNRVDYGAACLGHAAQSNLKECQNGIPKQVAEIGAQEIAQYLEDLILPKDPKTWLRSVMGKAAINGIAGPNIRTEEKLKEKVHFLCYSWLNEELSEKCSLSGLPAHTFVDRSSFPSATGLNISPLPINGWVLLAMTAATMGQAQVPAFAVAAYSENPRLSWLISKKFWENNQRLFSSTPDKFITLSRSEVYQEILNSLDRVKEEDHGIFIEMIQPNAQSTMASGFVFKEFDSNYPWGGIYIDQRIIKWSQKTARENPEILNKTRALISMGFGESWLEFLSVLNSGNRAINSEPVSSRIYRSIVDICFEKDRTKHLIKSLSTDKVIKGVEDNNWSISPPTIDKRLINFIMNMLIDTKIENEQAVKDSQLVAEHLTSIILSFNRQGEKKSAIRLLRGKPNSSELLDILRTGGIDNGIYPTEEQSNTLQRLFSKDLGVDVFLSNQRVRIVLIATLGLLNEARWSGLDYKYIDKLKELENENQPERETV